MEAGIQRKDLRGQLQTNIDIKENMGKMYTYSSTQHKSIPRKQ